MTPEEKLHVLAQAFNWCLIGGNSLASNLIGILGGTLSQLTRETAWKGIEQRLNEQGLDMSVYSVYEQWLCWKSLMEARDQVEQALGEGGWRNL